MLIFFCVLLFIDFGMAKILDYCIIGAGPSGLQMGYFLEKAKRDYLVFDKADKAGSFYEKYPRHRKLISINKRYTGKSNKEFNFRHDWNSLISHDESLLFTKYSEDYFPHADKMVEYLRDFQQKLNIKVQFNTQITKLTFTGDKTYRFSMKDNDNNDYACKNVFVATGLSVPITPPVLAGGDLIEHYETVSINPADYKGQSVLIFGKGNSGFEMAASLYGQTAFVHVGGRRRIRLSWETHYVGDLRGLNNELLDAYMLKSLDAIHEDPVSIISLKRESNGKIYLHFNDSLLPVTNVHYSPETNEDDIFSGDNTGTREGYDRVISCLGFTWDRKLFDNSTIPSGSKLFSNNKDHILTSKVQSKFPDIGYDYQSTQFPGMYFLGPLGHSVDFGKSAGGFIHGFRYTGAGSGARALFNLLHWKNHGIPWPTTSKDVRKLAPSLLKRANEGSGIYQMFEYFGDVIIIDRKESTFTHLEDYPIRLLAQLVNKTGHGFEPDRNSLLVMVLEYGKKWSKPGQDHFGQDRFQEDALKAHNSNFLHPVFYFYHQLPTINDMEPRKTEETLPKPAGIHHIVEDFTTIYDGPKTHLEHLRKFIEHFLDADLRIFDESSCLLQKLSLADISRYCRKIALAVDI